MPRETSPRPDFSARLSFWLLAIFLGILWIAGGASRGDVAGQAVVRFSAWAFLIAFVLFSTRFEWRRVWPVAAFMALLVLLVAVQLIALPPSVWISLPGRDLLAGAARVSEQPQPWRPMSISPGATVNALGALVVPAAVLVFCANLTREQHWRILALVLSLVTVGCLLATLQFSGAQFNNSLINFVKGSVSGNFANRNHFALFVAMGCLLAPIWGFRHHSHSRWKPIVALGLLPLFLLVNFATGSRSGLLLAGVALAAGLFIVRSRVRQQLQSLPRWAALSLTGGAAVALVSAIAASLVLGRAVSVDRTLDATVADDLRTRALPYVIEALGRFFPVGAGAGTFDPAYRIVEPDILLNPQYFNHAHNDWLEIILESGLAGLILLLAGVGWWAVRTWQVHRKRKSGATLERAASAAILLVMLASITDYPARTPMIMAFLAIMAIWLNFGASDETGSSG